MFGLYPCICAFAISQYSESDMFSVVSLQGASQLTPAALGQKTWLSFMFTAERNKKQTGCMGMLQDLLLKTRL